MRSVLERMARAGYAPIHTQTAADAKASYEKGSGVLEVPKAPLARVEDFRIAASDGYAIPARLYAPSEEKLPALMYFHGGGFTIGSIDSHDILCRELSRLSGCAVVSVGYRLAPEFRFPTAFGDAWDALQWLGAHGGERGLRTDRMAVGGDSAGGTLAATCAILARDAGLPVALQLLFYPGCAATTDAPSHTRYAQGLVLEQEHIDWFFDQFIARGNRADWRFAPLEAPDVEGVAPAWFGLAECDPLVDDGIAYADKLRAAGVAVDLEIYRGVTHEFIKMGRALPEARQAHSDAARALASALTP
ncbi:alpha/beta hydrolase [Caenimonas aquaedulcis]|uniref:Alpha/beta hydrolase n=1 Tax=Caenimonas aquaedulcis TaxID=2793270 RepID=A0A931H1N0_9BURK|nr:alpha/beta hydrolase [Caenimonas aquaedulcis]MBG9386934.1 alpha/beta hydrolase [Caenimonas aquaedulcis]